MRRLAVSVVALMAGLSTASLVAAADYSEGGPDFRKAYNIDPKDWTEMGDPQDSLSFEFGARYWYSWGSQDVTSGGPAATAEDQAHIGELHMRIDDSATNTYLKGIAGYSIAINGNFAGPLGTGEVADGHIGYIGADFGWNAFSDGSESGSGPMIGYMYWEDAPDTGRFNFTTATSGADITYDPDTGQTFVPGDSAPNSLQMHALRLGFGSRINLNPMFDITAEVAAVPYAKVSGSVGADEVSFNTDVYAGPAQVPYGDANGNISTIRSSATSLDGWGYGAMAEGWIGMHPSENLTFRLGGRVWYLQGTADATYSVAQIGNPTDSDADGVFDTDPTFANAGIISTSNPFSLLRYGVLAEMTYKF